MDNKDDMSVRQAVWLRAWIAIAASSNCTRKDVPSGWADECLEQFDKRFPNAVLDQD